MILGEAQQLQKAKKRTSSSLMRAALVRDFLLLNGVTSSQIRELSGLGVRKTQSVQQHACRKRAEIAVSKSDILPSKAMIEAANKAASEK